ncbi:MAG: zinc ribbon domain-containing protein [Phycisphaeraceae bacterium]|nr:MAG: zinc ribbon domain-containing protein [Phycisphaeraceae bacterium]
MPTYEYRCKSCGHELEVFQSITAKPKRKCPECEQNALERLISGGGAVLFKGSGFYETDYRSKDYKQKADAEKKSGEPKSDSKSEGKPESKAEKKAEAKPAKGEKKAAPKT